MRILAIESTGQLGSVAALEGQPAGAICLVESRLEGGRTAQRLAPTLESLLAQVGWPPTSIELVALTTGPGSFTSLRIGVTAAKTFAYAVGAQIIGVDTMAVLAFQAESFDQLSTVLDAQRQELFVARFSKQADGRIEQQAETAIVAEQAWLASLNAGDRVTGPSLARLSASLPRGVEPLPQNCWQPTSAAVGQLAWQEYQHGRRDNLWALVPNYGRPSAAEEKRQRGAT